ncbi:hypothetical protein AB0G04_11405 [Actinoplanes sp. NPDC023801]|uniref:hypothetical protein n=1 Tax=Actinoplanes sp. NPDC023801 TaxID=3154595 RepID=UPI0033F2E2F7
MLDALGEQTRTWLQRHGFTATGMTPLLIHRLEARHQAQKHLGFAVMAGAVGGGFILQTGSTLVRVAGLGAVIISILAIRLLVRRRRRAVERQVAVLLTRRVAHTVPLRTREVIGSGFISAVVLMYLGAGLLVLIAGSPQHEARIKFAVVALMATLGVLDVIEVSLIMRRPALADDARSLAIDDVLRAEDARTVLASLLPVVLSWTVLDLRLEPSMPALASLALLALLFWLGWAAEHVRAPRAQGVFS